MGTKTSTTAETVPLHTAVSRHDNGERRRFAWATGAPQDVSAVRRRPRPTAASPIRPRSR
ncbi:hypothetical protein ACIRRH_36525 [Kitasatospora sp. NPDC101235]|uniref:hypothetical protein n=1 Tax=Kitasatospora sp. NPDC101235 TaxID=3364101 RepID=UPI0037F35735